MRGNQETEAQEIWTYKKEGYVREYHFESFHYGKRVKTGAHSDAQRTTPTQDSAPMKKMQVPWRSQKKQGSGSPKMDWKDFCV